MRKFKIKTRRSWNQRDAYKARHSFYRECPNIYTGDIHINRPKVNAVFTEEVNVNFSPQRKRTNVSPKHHVKKPIQSTHETPVEIKKKAKNWKLWVGLSLAGVAAAGIGIFLFNKNK